jgi:hypothetical protein
MWSSGLCLSLNGHFRNTEQHRGMQPVSLYRKFAQLCLERMQEATDPQVRSWWISVADLWHARAITEEKHRVDGGAASSLGVHHRSA